MDKKQDLELSNIQLKHIIEISQIVRDNTATLFEKRHLSIKECIGVIGSVAAIFLCEFDEQCPNTSRQEIRDHLIKIIDACLDSYDNNKDDK